MAQFAIIWEAPEFEYHEKGVSWYWISIIVAAIIIAFSVWQRDFLFGFFIVIAEVLLITWGNETPRMIVFALDENGIAIGEYKHNSLKEFESWSAQQVENDYTELAFNFHARLKIPIKVLVPTEKLEEIRVNLKPLLREVEYQTTFFDTIERLLGF